MTLDRLAIVGATGAVGRELLAILEQRGWRGEELRLIASARSAGRELEFRGERLRVEALRPGVFDGIDVALFAASGDVAREWAGPAGEAGAVVIDNSSAFRLDEDVPLVVPECNPDAVRERPRGIIANPNCSTIILVVALAPIVRAVGIRRVVASTYQAASGAGIAAIDELHAATAAALRGEDLPTPTALPHTLGFNLFPRIDVFRAGDYTREEDKMMFETRKILALPELAVEATCVRVPVERCHSESVTVELGAPLSAADARALLRAAPGLVVEDDPSADEYPQPITWSGSDPVAVGRIRASRVFDPGLTMWIVGDQLRKGAALNALQIADLLAAE
ncbi:MAG: aspartate-semialdehyde dehydrogenase [Planctomycetes bacterium]|nr:aspartate-semialdehyde dehydrogenase [Planctomycetota bacterium]